MINTVLYLVGPFHTSHSGSQTGSLHYCGSPHHIPQPQATSPGSAYQVRPSNREQASQSNKDLILGIHKVLINHFNFFQNCIYSILFLITYYTYYQYQVEALRV